MPSIEILDIKSQENIDLVRLANLYDPCMEINKWVLTARTAAKFTQEQLGEALGVTKGNVSAWENGRHEPSLSQIKKIGQICEADLFPLFEGTSLSISLIAKTGDRWPFKTDFKLYATLPDEQKQDLDELVTLTIEQWHRKNPTKSKKAG